MLVQKSTIAAVGRMCSYNSSYYKSILEAVLMQQWIIGALGRLCWYSRIRYEQSKGCAGTAQYFTITQEPVLLQQSTICVLGYVVLVQKSFIGALWGLC